MVVTLVVMFVAEAHAQVAVPVTRLTLDEAILLAVRENASLRAKEFEFRATQANEITAALRPNPIASYAAVEAYWEGVLPVRFPTGSTVWVWPPSLS